MTSTDLMPAALLALKAIVYVRQSTQSQVMTNLESQRPQTLLTSRDSAASATLRS